MFFELSWHIRKTSLDKLLHGFLVLAKPEAAHRDIAIPKTVEKGTLCPGSPTCICVVPSHLHFRPALVVMDGIKMSKESM